jgi:hypothetical protein
MDEFLHKQNFELFHKLDFETQKYFYKLSQYCIENNIGKIDTAIKIILFFLSSDIVAGSIYSSDVSISDESGIYLHRDIDPEMMNTIIQNSISTKGDISISKILKKNKKNEVKIIEVCNYIDKITKVLYRDIEKKNKHRKSDDIDIAMFELETIIESITSQNQLE